MVMAGRAGSLDTGRHWSAVVYLAQADNVTGIALNIAGGLVMH
jgi:hypothetical protein